jgi:hypothetical protein
LFRSTAHPLARLEFIADFYRTMKQGLRQAHLRGGVAGCGGRSRLFELGRSIKERFAGAAAVEAARLVRAAMPLLGERGWSHVRNGWRRWSGRHRLRRGSRR